MESRGDVNVLAALIQDVSRLQKLETELAIQNERYRLLEETSNEILFEVDFDKDTLCYSVERNGRRTELLVKGSCPLFQGT